jgi:demethylmenaquinone methyltransferase/2-methoxy-6-polyprenyl-1,4-benzoquinol methylase
MAPDEFDCGLEEHPPGRSGFVDFFTRFMAQDARACVDRESLKCYPSEHQQGLFRQERTTMLKDFQVKRMFESIAFSYDFQNSVLSLGQDISWRKTLAESIHFLDGHLILDMATGTAEVAIEIWKHHPQIRVIGMDFSPRMLSIARKKVRARNLEERICLSLGDARFLPLKNASFNAVTMAFGIRNIEERREVLSEFNRILKPGGQLLIMEFGYPDYPLMKRLYRLYFERVLPLFGNWLSRTDYAYTHLVESVRSFPREEEFLEEIAESGFAHLRVKKLTHGIAKIYSGIKPTAPSRPFPGTGEAKRSERIDS